MPVDEPHQDGHAFYARLVSTPRIPGYLGDRAAPRTLGAIWEAPEGDYPASLWPKDRLDEIDPRPSGWQVIEEHFFTDEAHGGVGTILVPPDGVASVLASTGWGGDGLGQVGVWDSGRFDDGLVDPDPPYAEFFAQVRTASGAPEPQIEVSLPFLWFWDAYATPDGWRYVNRAGREQDLIRFTRSDRSWRVEVRALELRTYLAARDRVAIVQVDLVLKESAPEFPRTDATHHSDWAHFDFHAIDRGLGGPRRAYSRLLGKYAIAGQRTARVPKWDERRADRQYPDFTYGVDADSGAMLTHTCDPEVLGTYFDGDGSRVHYLTPVYFTKDVLKRYTSEPTRYTVSAARLSCLDLWGVSISFSSTGLVEVYLGDIGRDIPSEEWGHWLSHNVAPDGVMDEGRFRRDFLGQFAESTDPVGDLRRMRDRADQAAMAKYGQPLWQELPRGLDGEYRSLMGPLSDDPAALTTPLLVLTKTVVDALNSKLLKSLVPADKNEQSLSLLRRLLTAAGDPGDASRPLRDLQALRSRGGIAHLENSASAKAAAEIGVSGLGAQAAFDTIVARLTAALASIVDVLERQSDAVEVLDAGPDEIGAAGAR